MDPNNQNKRFISITKEETAHSHVDDMLQRQRNMQGKAGMRRREDMSWYYQNWFIFTIVCLIGATLSWMLLEPYIHDMAYFQGVVSELLWYRQPETVRFPMSDKEGIIIGELKIRDNRIRMIAGMRPFEDEKLKEIPKKTDLSNGQLIGIYADEAMLMSDLQHQEGMLNIEPVMVGFFYDTKPPAEKAVEGAKDITTYRQHQRAMRFIYFAIIAGVIGLFLGAADGFVCRLPRRAFLCGTVGLIIGLLGGFISGFIANLVFHPLYKLAMNTEGVGGQAILVAARSLSWAIAGMAMGLGQGIALRSRKLMLYGFIGGIIGGLLGGMLFDPIALIKLNPTSGHISRFIGISIIGATVGLMIGIVELLARDAWLRMIQGPLAGKEFLMFKDFMYVGASPKSDIYLFNDDQVADFHAILRSSGDFHEIESAGNDHDILVNGQVVKRLRLRSGDQITIGATVFTYQERKR